MENRRILQRQCHESYRMTKAQPRNTPTQPECAVKALFQPSKRREAYKIVWLLSSYCASQSHRRMQSLFLPSQFCCFHAQAARLSHCVGWFKSLNTRPLCRPLAMGSSAHLTLRQCCFHCAFTCSSHMRSLCDCSSIDPITESSMSWR